MPLSTLPQEWSGCISSQFITAARSKFFRALVDAGTKPEKFVTWMKILPRHARAEHEWEDGKCDSLTLCSCGQCGEGDVKCEGKVYKGRNVLTSPYHSLAYQIECELKGCKKHMMSFTLCLAEVTLIKMRPLIIF